MLNQSHNKPLSYKTLDAWRGLAAFWVVLVHAALMPTVLQNSPEMASQPLYAFSLLGPLGVQIFFVISGFCIANAAVSSLSREGGSWQFVKARCRRIYPPYIIASLCAAALALIAAKMLTQGRVASSSIAAMNPLDQPLKYYLTALTLTQVPFGQQPILDVCWTLCYEVGFYAIVFAMLIGSRVMKLDGRRMLDGMHVLTLVMLALWFVKPHPGPFPLNLWPQFGIGVLVFDILTHPREKRPIVLAIIAGAMALTIAVRDNHPDHFEWVGSRGQFIACVAFAVALLILHRSDGWLMSRRVVRVMAFVGTFSYSLYLTHLLAQGVTIQLFKRAGNVGPDNFAYMFWTLALVPLPAAFVFFWLFERPFISTSRRRTTDATAAPTLAGGENPLAAPTPARIAAV
jgi:peptidoglycan/LPS O-acetylase OafA/YrhL